MTKPKFTKLQIKEEIRRRVSVEIRRRDPAKFKELVRNNLLDSLHSKQRAVIADLDRGSRFISLCTSRRAGKTYTLATLIVLKLLEAAHNQSVIFISPTLTIGKRIIWDELIKIIKDNHLGWDYREHLGTVRTPEGGKFAILGLATSGKAEAPRGADLIAAFVDEVQDSEHLLLPLLTAIEPALAGSNGILVLAGTPGYQPVGTWHAISVLGNGGFEPHHFTLLDNPHLGVPPEQILAETLERKNWTPETPEFLREYKGLWVPDDSTMVFSFHPEMNSITTLPDDYSSHWIHCMGIDLGFNDHSAWSVIALDRATGRKIILHSESHPKIYSDQAAEITKRLVEQYQCRSIVCDPAAGGLGFYTQFNATHSKAIGATIKGANKVNKPGRIAQFNSELRSGRLVLLRPQTDDLARELQTLRYRSRDTCEFLTSASLRDDITDTALYALVELMPINPVKQATPSVSISMLDRLFNPHSQQRSIRDQIVG